MRLRTVKNYYTDIPLIVAALCELCLCTYLSPNDIKKTEKEK